MADLRIRDTSAAHLGRRRGSSGAAECMPTFIIIGAAKAGTTALHSYLGQHPMVYFTRLKEPNFFAFEGETVAFCGPGDDYTINSYSVTDLATYQAGFCRASGETARGEASVIYLYNEKAPRRIRHHVPDARLIIILREPIERAYSSFLFAKRDGRELYDDFLRAVAAEESRIREGWQHLFHYTQVGLYHEQLLRYYDLFPADQIKVFLYEDLKTAPLEVIAEIFRFIGVDDSFVPDMSYRPFVSGIPRSRALQRLLFKPFAAKRVIKHFVPEGARQRLKEAISARNVMRPPMPPEARERLLPIFREDILKLQGLIDRDLGHWLR